jgi:hypothetical protein
VMACGCVCAASWGGWGPTGGGGGRQLNTAFGDAQVTRLAAHIQARAYGASTIAAQSEPLFQVPERTAPFTGSAIVECVLLAWGVFVLREGGVRWAGPGDFTAAPSALRLVTD